MKKYIFLGVLAVFCSQASEKMISHIEEFSKIVRTLQEDFKAYEARVKNIKDVINEQWEKAGYDDTIKDAASVYLCQGEEYEKLLQRDKNEQGKLRAKMNVTILNAPLNDFDLVRFSEFEYFRKVFDQIKSSDEILQIFSRRFLNKVFVH